jgi:hypothetical protein
MSATITQILAKNASRLSHTPAFQDSVASLERFRHHPTDASKYTFFSHQVARSIWDSKSHTFITPALREEVDFVIHVLSHPDTYRWESPIAHLIPREPDGEVFQDACPWGGGGFSPELDFWWALDWPIEVFERATKLSSNDPCYISNNLLEYAAILFGLAGAILAWEALPPPIRPPHPFYLFWTDNMAARAWTTKISGIKTPQGRSLVRLFAHLLMFSDLGVEAQHIKGTQNIIADFLSRASLTHNMSSFTYRHIQTRFPWLTLSRRFFPSSELLALVFTALLRPSVTIPTTRVMLGQLIAESPTSNQNFFRSQS